MRIVTTVPFKLLRVDVFAFSLRGGRSLRFPRWSLRHITCDGRPLMMPGSAIPGRLLVRHPDAGIVDVGDAATRFVLTFYGVGEVGVLLLGEVKVPKGY